MSVAAPARLLTTADLLALPDDGVERYLINGRLREKPLTKRNRFHSRIEARIAQLLGNWLDHQPGPRGEVFSGEAGCILRHDPDTTVGIDVAFFSGEAVRRQSEDTTLIDGVPVLAVEILSPNDTVEEIHEKTDQYRAAGVALVWLVDPHHQTVQILRPGAEPEMFNVTQELSGEPHLPGFRVRVAQLFGR